MDSGTRLERTAAQLLSDPDRLLSAVLFWNLVINVTYFAMASILSPPVHLLTSALAKTAPLGRIGQPRDIASAALFQVGEFSFVLAGQARHLDLLGEADSSRFLAVAITTMLFTPFVMKVAAAVVTVGANHI